ncbi:MAG: uracil-DNA glycosylase [Oscillospiraceae bacterium]|jgi:uracil-DNA glycosylase family 4|nr:uracil-DNA glycosylase [Oscillospiraceae bacterium]
MVYRDWDNLIEQCKTCNICALASTRTNVVVGVGNPKAEVMFIGEGPGEQEDLKGEAFVGRSGRLLDKMLEAVGLSRKHNIYIANIVKCRPPNNRDPLPAEQEACINWLRAQTALIRPKIIVCLGRVAACRIISPDFKVTKQHGQFIKKGDTLMMGTFHPAALLRNPSQKPQAFADFLELRNKINEICTHTELIYEDL